MESCIYVPQVKDKKGNSVDSILYKDIKNIVKDYNLSWSLYSKTLTEDFKNIVGNSLSYDKNGEPTIDSIILQTDLLDRFEPEAEFIKREETKLGKYDANGNQKEIPDTYQNRVEYGLNVVKYNDSRLDSGKAAKGDKVAVLRHQIGESSSILSPSVEKSSGEAEFRAKKMKARLNLYNYLAEYLGIYGVGIGVLDSTLGKYDTNANGVIDFSEIPDFAEGLVNLIKLAKGEKGEKALPEEFSHFIISATVGNNIIDRLVKNIKDNNLSPVILGNEFEDTKALQDKQPNIYGVEKEAAGKLLAMALQGKNPKLVVASLMERSKNVAQEFFSEMDLEKLYEAIQNAVNDAEVLSDEVFSNKISGETSLANITDRGIFYNIDAEAEKQKKSLDRKRKILESAIFNETRKFRISERTKSGTSKNFDYTALINRMQTNLSVKQEMKGIYDYILTEYVFCQEANDTLEQMRKGTFEGNRNLALRHIRTQLKSCEGVLQEIERDIREDERDGISSYSTDIINTVNTFRTEVLSKLMNNYERITEEETVGFYKKYFGNEVGVYLKGKKKIFNIEDIFSDKINVRDISFAELWLDAARDSNSFVLQAYDKAIKQAKEKTRIQTQSIARDLLASKKKLEKAGIKDTDWIYEVDENGNLTGNFVTEIDIPKVKQATKDFWEYLNNKYGKNPKGAAFKARQEELIAFNRTIGKGKGASYDKKFYSQAYKEIMADANKKEFYEKIMNLKENLDESAGLVSKGYTEINRVPRILSDTLQRVKNSSSVKDGAQTVYEALKDTFVRRSDDTSFGVMGQAALTDFENRQVNILPLYYLKLQKGEHLRDLSKDTVSTMVAYANMVNDYNNMGEIIDQMEVVRDTMSDRLKVAKLHNGNVMSQLFKAVAGDSESEAVIKQDFNASNLGKRLEALMLMNAYGQEFKDEGTFNGTKISKAKVGGWLMGATAFTGLALNTLAAIANAALNVVNINTEAFGKRWFNPGNLWRADKYFDKHLFSLMGELESRAKTNMISLFNQEYNITQDLDKDLRDIKARKKTWVGRAFDGRTLYFMTTAGDNWAYFRTAFAVLDNYKLKDKDGKEISLLNAYERVYLDENDHSKGAYLKLKDGVTKLDGTAFTEADKQLVKARMEYVSQEMFGIYNSLDKNMLQRTVLGRMAIMYRKYMRPNWNRRFKGRKYIAGIEEEDEGYYRTLGRLISGLYRDLIKSEFDISARWDSFEDWEKKNIRKAVTEIAQFALAAVFAFWLFKDPDKDDPWLKRMAAYNSRRLFMEMGAFIPGPTMFTEGMQLVKSPMACINTIENTIDLLGLLLPQNYSKEMQSGRFKGHSKAYKIFFESPFGMQSRSIYRAVHPEIAYDFFRSSTY